MDQYCLPLNYSIRKNNKHFSDIDETDKYQKEVYIYANTICKKLNLKKIVDIGCGSGFKLIKYLNEYETIGFETEPCISFLKNKYPDRKWINSGEKSKSFNYNINDITCDIVICSDVIEHILDPNELIHFLKYFDSKYFLISTPCRKRLVEMKRRTNNGPPELVYHVREWTYEEFKLYLKKHFNILESYLGVTQQSCQWHLCEKI